MIAVLSETSILIIAVVLVVLFGGSQLPKLARNVGTAGKEFRKAQTEAEAESAAKDAAAAQAAAQAPVVPPAPAAIPPAPYVVPPVTAAPAPAAAPAASDQITVSKSELEALLDEREARARRESPAS